MRFDKKKEEKEKFKRTYSLEEKEGKECPQCGEENETEAKFCAECGQNLQPEKHCPRCSVKVSPNSDICEACGEWLLEGKCKFCYESLEVWQNYCGECGNPAEGIHCPQCGKLSNFDFCNICHIPLTEAAKSTIEEAQNDPSYQELISVINGIENSSKDPLDPQKEELLKMKAYMAKGEEKEKKIVFTPLFSDKQRENIDTKGKEVELELRKIEEEKKRLEEERIRKEEEKRRKLEELNKQIAEKTFEDNQEARRFHDAYRPSSNPIGWICNYVRHR